MSPVHRMAYMPRFNTAHPVLQWLRILGAALLFATLELPLTFVSIALQDVEHCYNEYG